MNNHLKLLSMTAAVALLSAPALAHKSVTADVDADGRNETLVKYSKSKDAFTRIDENHDGRITMNEFENNTMHDNEPAVFKMFDQNDDGYVTRAEIEQNRKTGGDRVNSSARSVSNLKSKSGAPVGSMDEKYYNGTAYIDNPFYDDPELANDVDYDIDNPFVDDPELANDVNWEWPEHIDRNKPLFNQLDDNNDGRISQAEFQRNTIHNNEANLFAMLDKNENGTISKYELKKYEKTGGRK